MTILAIWKRAALLWVLVLTACTIQLVPSYDQALVEGLDGANAKALTLFAEVESGSKAEEFADYKERYGELIGSFEALRQRAENRDIPPLAARLSKLSVVRDFCNSKSDPAGCLNVSPASLAQVLKGLRMMRDTHRSQGLAPDVVEGFRNDYDTAIAQVLTVENALKR